jgi:hypothetical protein
VTRSIAITNTISFTQTSTTTKVATVLITASNLKTLTSVDTPVVISKRAVYTTPAWSLTTIIISEKEQPKVESKYFEDAKGSVSLPKACDNKAYHEWKGVLVKRDTTYQPVISTFTATVQGGTVTQTATITAAASVTNIVVVTISATTTSTVVVGAQTTVHITSTSKTTKGASAEAQSPGDPTNPFTVTGPVAPALSTLRALVPSSAQTDPAAGCFVQQSYSACYTTPSWWSTIPNDSQSYFSSVNSANNAACTSCPTMGGEGNTLSTGAKAGIGIGAVAGVAALAALAFLAIKTGVLGSLFGGVMVAKVAALGGGAAAGTAASQSAMNGAAAGQASQAQMAQSAMGSQATGWSGMVGDPGTHAAAWSGMAGDPGTQAGWSGVTGHSGVHGHVATAAGVTGAIAAGAILGQRRESQQSIARRPVPSSVTSQDSRLPSGSSPALSSQPENHTQQQYYPPPQAYQYQQPYQQPYQQRYEQAQNLSQQYQQQRQPQWQNQPSPEIQEMGQTRSPANPDISPTELHGHNHIEAAGRQIYESDARERSQWR